MNQSRTISWKITSFRQAIDDLALRELLASRFQDVEVDRYFSTQSPMFQAIGSKYLPDYTFGIKGRGRKPSGGAENYGSYLTWATFLG